jgi:hypothetical protein
VGPDAAEVVERASRAAEPGEAACLLAFLTGRHDGGGVRRLVPRRVRDVVADGRTPVCRPCLLVRVEDLRRAVEAFASHGGREAFFVADPRLALRFSHVAGRLSFRAHHAMVQDELRDYCEDHGIDLH